MPEYLYMLCYSYRDRFKFLGPEIEDMLADHNFLKGDIYG